MATAVPAPVLILTSSKSVFGLEPDNTCPFFIEEPQYLEWGLGCFEVCCTYKYIGTMNYKSTKNDLLKPRYEGPACWMLGCELGAHRERERVVVLALNPFT